MSRRVFHVDFTWVNAVDQSLELSALHIYVHHRDVIYVAAAESTFCRKLFRLLTACMILTLPPYLIHPQESTKSEMSAEGMKLIHSGKILKDDDTIESCNIKPSDFLVVMVSKKKAPAPAPAAAAAPAPAAPETPAPAASTTPAETPATSTTSAPLLHRRHPLARG